eukprot:UN21695
MYWGLLSFYKLSSLYWDFVFLLISPCIGDFTFVRFPLPCAEDFAFYDISYVLETLGFTNFPSILRTLRLGFSPCIKDFVFLTSFPMYWELLSFYKLFLCTENFSNVYEFPVLGTMRFYDFPPVLKTLSFSIFHLYWRLWFYFL